MEKNIPFLTFSEGGSSTHVYGSIESLGEAFTLQQIIQNTLNYSGQTETREKSEGENEGDSDRDSDRESVRERGISENWENRLRRTAASARDIERDKGGRGNQCKSLIERVMRKGTQKKFKRQFHSERQLLSRNL